MTVEQLEEYLLVGLVYALKTQTQETLDNAQKYSASESAPAKTGFSVRLSNGQEFEVLITRR